MFESNSRYASIPHAEHTRPDGEIVTYVRRRFLPPGESLDLLAEVTIAEGDRLDLIAARTLGDPEAFWAICDANDAMNPVELLMPEGRVLRIPVPGFR